MKAYRVVGTFLMGGTRQPFVKEVTAEDREAAAEWVYSVLGSNHRAKRRGISVDAVDEIPMSALERGRRRSEAPEEE